jgi:hypothetical protein
LGRLAAFLFRCEKGLLMKLADILIEDLRPKLRVVPSTARVVRHGAPTSMTLHWNGPAVKAFGDPDGEIKQILGPDLNRHINYLGADSLQYHFCILSDGSIWQTRDLNLEAWHCGHKAGNRWSIAVHFVLGKGQVPTLAQWAAAEWLFEGLIGEFGMAGREVVKGHLEWKESECPGPYLMERLRAWREARPGVRRYQVIVGIDFAAVREGRSTKFPIALDGEAMLAPGAIVEIDDVSDTWAHLASGLGFVHMSLLREVR